MVQAATVQQDLCSHERLASNIKRTIQLNDEIAVTDQKMVASTTGAEYDRLLQDISKEKFERWILVDDNNTSFNVCRSLK